jgi:hypothetical protein
MRALEDGMWKFGKGLVIMIDFDATKLIEEMEFTSIRFFKLPIGMMHKTMGEAIGGEVGEFMEMVKDEGGTTVGRYLGIKV